MTPARSLPLLALLLMAFAPARVIDGDTLRLDGVTIRVADLDAPEVGRRARCDRERDLGNAATAHARRIIAAARSVTYTPLYRDRYGRTVARVQIDGTDMTNAMIQSGYAVRWVWGQKHRWCR